MHTKSISGNKNPDNMQPVGRKRISTYILTCLMLFLSLIFLFPFIWMLSTSLKLSGEVFEFPIRWIPKILHWENYVKVWAHPSYPFYRSYLNSIFVTGITIFGALFISSTAGYAFSKINFKGKNGLFMMYMAMLMVPVQVTIVPRFALFYWLGIYNTLWALILPGIVYVVGIFFMRQTYASIPLELSEAATIDGAGHLRIWSQIMLPLTRTSMVSIIMLVFVMSWNEYMNPLIFITSKELYTIPLGLQAFIDDELKQYNLVMAAASSAIIPVLILFLGLQKYFVNSIVTSGIKG